MHLGRKWSCVALGAARLVLGVLDGEGRGAAARGKAARPLGVAVRRQHLDLVRLHEERREPRHRPHALRQVADLVVAGVELGELLEPPQRVRQAADLVVREGEVREGREAGQRLGHRGEFVEVEGDLLDRAVRGQLAEGRRKLMTTRMYGSLIEYRPSAFRRPRALHANVRSVATICGSTTVSTSTKAVSTSTSHMPRMTCAFALSSLAT